MYALAQVDRTQSEWSLSRTQGRLDAGHDVDLLETGTPDDLLHPLVFYRIMSLVAAIFDGHWVPHSNNEHRIGGAVLKGVHSQKRTTT